MHRDFFLRHAALGTMAVAALLPVPAPAADAIVIVIDAGKIKWGDVPPSLPRGAQMAVLQGDPSKPEPFVLRLKAPANYRIAPHWHSNDENLTVLSGAFHLGMGERADRATAQVFQRAGKLLSDYGGNVGRRRALPALHGETQRGSDITKSENLGLAGFDV